MIDLASRWSVLPLLLASLLAQSPTAPAATPGTTPVVAPKPRQDPHGRVDLVGELKILHVWGTPAERGYAHGFLLASEVTRVGIGEFTARFAPKPALLKLARDAVARLIEYPEDVQQEIEGLYQGLLDSKVDLDMPKLGRSFDLTDLLVANALDVFGLMGCSGFTVWGDEVQGGGVLTARNFDWPFTGMHLLDGTIVCVEHFANGRAVASVTWPGYVATVTGVSSEGVAAFLHVGTGKISMTPEPSSWPTAVAARRILKELLPADGDKSFAKAKELLGNTSPPAGYLTRVVLPIVPVGGAPVAVFETDRDESVKAEPAKGVSVVTNHFASRKDGRPPSKDSIDREAKVRGGVDTCLHDGDHQVSVAEAWQVLESVQRGNARFGTLHSLVFRNAPWCFELRIGEKGEKGCVPAPVSTKRYVLTRDQLFPKDVPAAKRG
jgi:hypothetical protein